MFVNAIIVFDNLYNGQITVPATATLLSGISGVAAPPASMRAIRGMMFHNDGASTVYIDVQSAVTSTRSMKSLAPGELWTVGCGIAFYDACYVTGAGVTCLVSTYILQ